MSNAALPLRYAEGRRSCEKVLSLPQIPMRPGLATVNENARSALECGRGSYRLPPSVHTANVRGAEGKAVAAATALQGVFGTATFIPVTWRRREKIDFFTASQPFRRVPAGLLAGPQYRKIPFRLTQNQ